MVLHRWVVSWDNYYTTTGASDVAFPVGNWERANPAARNSRAWGELAAELGAANFAFGFQVCNEPNVIDASTKIGVTYITTAGPSVPVGSAIDIDGQKFIRPVVFLKSGTDATLAGGALAGVIELYGYVG